VGTTRHGGGRRVVARLGGQTTTGVLPDLGGAQGVRVANAVKADVEFDPVGAGLLCAVRIMLDHAAPVGTDPAGSERPPLVKRRAAAARARAANSPDRRPIPNRVLANKLRSQAITGFA